MKRKAPDEKVQRFFHSTAARESLEIKHALENWASERTDALACASPDMPSVLTDRQEEVLTPLISIADDLGGPWPDRARRAGIALSGRGVARADPATQILADLRRVWDGLGDDRAHTAELVRLMSELEDPMYMEALTAQQLSFLLSRFDIHSEANPFRRDGRLRRGYLRSAFDDAFNRYLGG